MEFVGCLCTRNSFPFPYVFVCFSKKKKKSMFKYSIRIFTCHIIFFLKKILE